MMEAAGVETDCERQGFRVPVDAAVSRRGEKRGASPAPGTDDALGPAILCRYCLAKVTDPGQRTVTNGSHGHRRFNPVGVIFDIGCFRQAPGCQRDGEPTFAYTWFPGYAWTLALCSTCHSHLGWFFESAAGQDFAGLILDKLIESA